MTDKPEVMNGETLDIAEQRRGELKQLFPGVFTETTGANGEVVEAVDFERLKAELGTFTDVYEGRRERYGMDWPGKRDCMRLIQEPSRATLKPCREESVDFDNTKNLFIEGDNLEVLKLLQKSYYGKVKMIYIDPPYNTGKEFIYPDNYQESLETYLSYSGQVDDNGKRFSTNTTSEGRFHTKWLNMMYPRLYLAKNLLSDDGFIFVSIDENEVENLSRICDEIFGEENRLTQLVWKKSYGGGAKSKHVVGLHEYILVYAKDKNEVGFLELPPKDDVLKYYKFKDDKYDVRGPYRKQPLATNSMDDRPNLKFPIVKDGEEIWPEKQWQWSEDRVSKAVENDDLVFTKRGDGWTVDYKQYLKDENGKVRGAKPYSVLDGPYTQRGTSEIESIFGNGKVFTFPKPSELIYELLGYCGDGGLILDFFAGSCSSAHAALLKNSEQGCKFRYIAVQLPEPCDDQSQAFKTGFSTIAEIGKERIRSVGNAISGSKASLGSGAAIDIGFRVLKLSSSNFKQWNLQLQQDKSEEGLVEQLSLHVNHVDGLSTQEEILFELLSKAGFDLSEKIDELDVAGYSVFSVAEGALMICLEDELTPELIDAVADAEPMQFICLDKGFNGNDQLKANAVQTFKSKSQNSESELVFKVV